MFTFFGSDFAMLDSLAGILSLAIVASLLGDFG